MAAAEQGLRGGSGEEEEHVSQWVEVGEVVSLVKVIVGCGVFSLAGKP